MKNIFSGAKNKIQKVLKFVPLVLIVPVACLMAIAVDRTYHGPFASDLGGESQGCYSNKSCNNNLTCFEMREEFICLKEAKPAIPKGAKFCYNYSDKANESHVPCFNSERECILAFSQINDAGDNTVSKGCHYITE